MKRIRLTLPQCIAATLGTMLLGIVLTLWWPVWLAPPDINLTFLVYIFALLGWLPVFAICLVLRPISSRRLAVVWGIVAGVCSIVLICWSCLLIAWPLVFYRGTLFTCDRGYVPRPGTARYICSHSYYDVEHATQYTDPNTYTFEGPEGFFLVRLQRVSAASLP